jgi:heptosyltransferase II
MKAPSSILIVRYSALGDVVLATSVLDPLRARFPEARLEWVTDAPYVSLLEGLPHLAAVHGLRRGDCAGSRELRRRLRGRFDLAIDLQHKVRSALLARAAAPRRLTYRQRSPGRALLSLVGFDPPLARAHATALYAEVLSPLGIAGPGAMRIGSAERARAAAAEALRRARPPVVALAPGGRWATKRWPVERFAMVADALAGRGASLALVGGPTDRQVLEAFRATLHAPLAADLSSLPVDALAAALAQVGLLVTNDSGPVHLASAMGTPALVLFGPTSVVRWGPPAPGRALTLGLACSPCTNHGSQRCPEKHRRCLLDLPVERVVAEAQEMLWR